MKVLDRPFMALHAETEEELKLLIRFKELIDAAKFSRRSFTSLPMTQSQFNDWLDETAIW